MKTALTVFVLLFLTSCATADGRGFLDPFMDKVATQNQNAQNAQAAQFAGQAAADSANAAAAAANAASMSNMMMTPPPAGF